MVAVNVNPAVSPLAKPAVPSEIRAANKEKKKSTLLRKTADLS